MSDCDPDLATMFESVPQAARITAESVTQALKGFPLPPGRDMAWLAQAIRPAVYLAATSELIEDHQGNAATRDELQLLSDRTNKLWVDISELSEEAKDAVERFANERWLFGVVDVSPEGARDELEAYYEANAHLYSLAELLRKAAARIGGKKQPPKWRATARKDWRVAFAAGLTPAFEKGFGRTAVLNKRPYANPMDQPDHWADFYQRIMELAFDEKATSNRDRVLAEARKRVLKDGDVFGPGIIPE